MNLKMTDVWWKGFQERYRKHIGALTGRDKNSLTMEQKYEIYLHKVLSPDTGDFSDLAKTFSDRFQEWANFLNLYNCEMHFRDIIN